jgi:hypothetical protein
MKLLLFIVTFIFLINFQVNAQYKYDPQKVSAIRWTPMPSSVGDLKDFKIDLSGNWQFNASPEKDFFQKSELSGWKTIEVPGEWVMQGFTVKSGEYAGYVRSFKIPNEWKGKRILLKCEAVYSECEIWINKKQVGRHLGGMTAFQTDITSQVKNGENNISITVRSESLADTLSNASQYAVHPLGGITRPIYLIALPEVNVASFHVSTTFDSKYEDATLKTELKIANETAKEQKAELKLTLRDVSGKTIAATGKSVTIVTIVPNTVNPTTIELNVASPKKWDPEHPNLYFLECAVNIDGKEITKVIRRFGFRQIEVRKNQVFVNNQPIKLKGVCRHEVSPVRGRSLTGNQWAEDVRIFKEANVNYIRTSHYPPNEKLMDACDELGMFVEEEAPFCWAIEKPVNDENYFEAILQPTLEMVERDKSHPCIIQWSLANESENFTELFKTSADQVKAADPSRPRNFSQYGEDGDGGYLEIGNHHYPGPGGPDKYRDNRRPVTFDEFCHLNAYNRYELMTDPGVRDFWGDILLNMWEKMYYSKGVLGGALWAGIDDSFFLPGGPVVGYGTWGPIDGWRRPKPEYWHTKKIFTPVKVNLLEGQANDSVTLEMENRYFFSNLNECQIVWKNGNQSGKLNPDIKTGAKGLVKLPISYSALHKLTIDVYRDSEVPVDQYEFDLRKPVITEQTATGETFKWSKNGTAQLAESSKLIVSISNENLFISNSSGEPILNGWPVLMLIPLNSTGDTQMTKETPEYGLFSPAASNRKIEAIELIKENSSIKIVVKESYKEAVGKQTINLFADGHIELAFEFKMLTDANYRQWGISFTLPETMNTLNWKRKGLWSVYPDDHIGRNEGTAKLFSDHAKCGLAGPSTKPTWSYNMDQTKFGSNDFRSTKRNILQASLQSENASGIKVVSDGLQNLRCWSMNKNIYMLVSEHDNPGSERFLRDYIDHAARFDQPFKQGQTIQGTINLQISDKK